MAVGNYAIGMLCRGQKVEVIIGEKNGINFGANIDGILMKGIGYFLCKTNRRVQTKP